MLSGTYKVRSGLDAAEGLNVQHTKRIVATKWSKVLPKTAMPTLPEQVRTRLRAGRVRGGQDQRTRVMHEFRTHMVAWIGRITLMFCIVVEVPTPGRIGGPLAKGGLPLVKGVLTFPRKDSSAGDIHIFPWSCCRGPSRRHNQHFTQCILLVILVRSSITYLRITLAPRAPWRS